MVILGFVLLAAIPRVEGGTEGQRARLKAAAAKVPACLTSCDGKPPRVVVTNLDGEDPRYPAAFYAEDERGRSAIVVNPALASNTAKTERQEARAYCEDIGVTREFVSNLDAVLVHEYAHHWDDPIGCGNKVKSFLNLRYYGMKRAITRDPEYKKALADLQKNIARKKSLSPEEYQRRNCEIGARITAALERHNVPHRFNRDVHALENGHEYFAIAVEMMVTRPAQFCSSYSAEEVAWLRAQFGDCMTVPACGAEEGGAAKWYQP